MENKSDVTTKRRASQLLRLNKRHTRYLEALVCLALFVAVIVPLVLRQQGVAMTHEETVLDCHYAGTAAHTHTFDCYDANGELACPLPELELHVHDDGCYSEERELTCGLEEGEGHQHTDECYEVTRTLICDKEEISEEHVHGPGCFTTITVVDDQAVAQGDEDAQTLEGKIEYEDGMLYAKVSVVSPAAALPTGSTMKVEPADEGAARAAVETALDQVTSDEVAELRAVKVTFADAEGAECKPTAPVLVRLTSELVVRYDKPLVMTVDEDGKATELMPLDEQALAERELVAAEDEILFEAQDVAALVLVGTQAPEPVEEPEPEAEPESETETDPEPVLEPEPQATEPEAKPQETTESGEPEPEAEQQETTESVEPEPTAEPQETTEPKAITATELADKDAVAQAKPLDAKPTEAKTETAKAKDATYTYSIQNVYEAQLDEIFAKLGESARMNDVVKLESSDESLVAVEGTQTGKNKDGESVWRWSIAHKLPFFDTVTLTATMRDGSTITITLTDETNEELEGYRLVTLEDGTVMWDLRPQRRMMLRAMAYNADGSVQTITNPAGTKINLFDYWVMPTSDPSDGWPWYISGVPSYGNLSGVGNNQGINSSTSDTTNGHAIKFQPASDRTVYDGTMNYWSHPNVTGQGGINAWTGSPAPNQGLVKNQLVNNYPQLTNDSSKGTNGESLAYLFDPTIAHAGKQSYTNVDQLFHVDEDGYYVYDSDENSATFNGSTFTIGATDNGGFWPFGTNSYWFGVHMETPFSQPANGEVLNPSGQHMPMTYSFSGDDDVWIYIDGVLVADAGGVHSATDVDINFQTGDVRINGVSQGTIRDFYQRAGVAENYEWDTAFPGTFAAGTYHTMDFFYLERGAGASNMKIRYNMVSTADFTAHKSYIGRDSSDLLKRDQFQFELIGLNGQYTRNADGTLTLVDSNASAIMPDAAASHAGGAGTVADPHYTAGTMVVAGETVNSQSYITGDTEDGNVNFGKVTLNESEEGQAYRYIVREVIPTGATLSADGKTYTYNGTTYDAQVYYMSATVTSWIDEKTGLEEYGLSKRYYTDDTYTTLRDDVTFINFTNHHGDVEAPTVYVEPQATKVLTGKALSAGDFSFTIAAADTNAPLPANTTMTNDVNGRVIFGKITYDATVLAGIDVNTPKTFTYTITEVPGNESGYTYDTHVCTVVVTVSKNADGTYNATTTYKNGDTESADANVFYNTYTDQTITEYASLRAIKDLRGGELAGDDFEFELFQYTGNASTVPDFVADGQNGWHKVSGEFKNDANGKIAFDNVVSFSTNEFPTPRPSSLTKTFAIKEVVGTDTSITYATNTVYATVTAHIAENGVITVLEPVYSKVANAEGAITSASYAPVDTSDPTQGGTLTVGIANVTVDANGVILTTESGEQLIGTVIGDSAVFDVPGSVFAGDTVDNAEYTHSFTVTAGKHVAPIELRLVKGSSGGGGTGPASTGDFTVTYTTIPQGDLYYWRNGQYIEGGYYNSYEVIVTVSGDNVTAGKYYGAYLYSTPGTQSWAQATSNGETINITNNMVAGNRLYIYDYQIQQGGIFLYVAESDTLWNISGLRKGAVEVIVDGGSSSGTPDTYTANVLSDSFQPEAYEPTFVNVKTTAGLTVYKSVVGLASDKTAEFTFTVTLPAEANNVTYTIYDENNEQQSTGANPTSFTLKDGWHIAFEGLPTGKQVTVTETANNAFATTVARAAADGAIATVTTDNATRTATVTPTRGSAEIDYTNTRKQQKLQGLKVGTDNVTLSGAVFQLEKEDGTVITSNLTSGSDGTFTISDALEAGTVYLTETTAPAGYNALTHRIQIVVTSSGIRAHAEGDVTNYEVTGPDDNGVFTITVPNNPGRVLPHTGGRGVEAFTLVGILVMFAASVALLVRRMVLAQQ